MLSTADGIFLLSTGFLIGSHLEVYIFNRKKSVNYIDVIFIAFTSYSAGRSLALLLN